jgi:hypothetical protein
MCTVLVLKFYENFDFFGNFRNFMKFWKFGNFLKMLTFSVYCMGVTIISNVRAILIDYYMAFFISHVIWSALTNMKKDALKYMINRLWYGIFHIICHINPRPILALGPSGWYDMWYEKCHIIINKYCKLHFLYNNTSYYMTSDNVFSDWLTSLVTFLDKTL